MFFVLEKLCGVFKPIQLRVFHEKSDRAVFLAENKKGIEAAEDLSKALHLFAPIFEHISIPIYAHDLDPRYADGVVRELIINWDYIFKDVNWPEKLDPHFHPHPLGGKGYHPLQEMERWEFSYSSFRVNQFSVEINGQKVAISIPPVRRAVEPEGRFAKLLKEKGKYEQYVKHYQNQNPHFSDLCKELIKWPSLNVLPNGDVRLCIHYPAMYNANSLVTNLFNRHYEQAVSDLLARQRKEVIWVVEHLDDLVSGKVSGCKAMTSF